jgi:ABC-2 type transport system permease protein
MRHGYLPAICELQKIQNTPSMRTLKFLLRKEFLQIFRNKSLLPMIFIMPIIQLLIMPLAADYEVRNINISIVDHDHSPYSQKLIAKIVTSGYFKLADYSSSFSKAFQQIEKDNSDLILEIPQGFEKNLVRENQQKLFIAVNAINGTKAGLGGAYVGRIIQDFNSDIRTEWLQPQAFGPTPIIEIVSSNWYNTFLVYPFFMVPGILVVLVTMVCAYMCSLNIVKEKEIGTIEQINVTPIKKYHFILGKLIPFWVIGMFVFTLGLFLVGRLVYGIIPVGSIALLYAFLSLYLVALLGLGLLISTYSDTQQQSMSVAFFFIMIFLLMSGLFTSIDSMPEWAQVIARLNPVTYFIQVMRMVVLKGSGFNDIKMQFAAMLGFAIFFNSWAVFNYKKTS